MARTVYVLGAGASAPSGTPVMRNFMDVARELYTSGRVSDAEADFRVVFDAITKLQRVHSKAQLDTDNIEILFSACEMAETLQTFPDLQTSEIPGLVPAIRRVIVRTIEETQHFKISAKTNRYIAPEVYQTFVDEVFAHSRGEVAFLTFNYDVGLDLALRNKGHGVDYAIPCHPHRDNGVPLLKLHGSLNWLENQSGGVEAIGIDFLADQTTAFKDRPFKVTDALPRIAVARQLNSVPVIVPPSWSKGGFYRQISAVWKRAASELHNAEHVFVIGYSMPETDVFFRHLFALGTVGDQPLLTFQVMDMNGKIHDRFRELLGSHSLKRFLGLTGTFNGSLPH